MAIINTNPNPKDVVILQRDDTNTYYGETHISGSKLIFHINAQGHLDADTSQSFYALYPPNNDTASYAISASNFISDVPYPVDARMVKQTDADRDAIDLDARYEGLVVYVIDDEQDYKLVGGTNNSHWIPWPQLATSSSYASLALTASFALNGGGGGTSDLKGANGFVPVWLNNNFTSGSLIWVTKNNVSINNPNPVATDTFTVTEFSSSRILWTPTLISPVPRFWFKADSISRITGSSIDIWPDSSPNKNNATASSVSAEPVLVFDVLNSQQCVRFNGTTSQLKVLTPASVTASAVTAFVVARVNNYASSTTPSSMGTLFGNSHPGNDRDIVVGNFFNGGAGRFTWDVYTEDKSTNFFAETPVTPFNALTNQWYINTVIVNGASSTNTIYLSGSASGSTTSTLSNNLDLRDLYIGYESASNKPFDGDIAEIVIFTSSLSTQNQQYVEGYLAWKFGLQGNLPPTHPYKNSMPLSSGSVGNIQIWQDFNGNTVAAMSSSGILYVTASNAISASWAPNQGGGGSSVSASWASASLSSSVSISSSYSFTASSAVNSFQAVSASWAPPIASNFAISASWASESFWATSGSFSSASVFAISASWASRSIFASTASFASQSHSSSVSISSSFAVTASFATNLNPNAVSASWASQSLSASFAVTASFATNLNPNAVSASWASQSLSSSTAISSSWARVAIFATSASWASQSISASWAPPIPSDFAISASWASQSFWATSASFASNSISASWAPPQNSATAVSASWASQSLSASYATQASTSFLAISASWAPSVGTIGTDFYVPKWLGNSLTHTSLIYDSGLGVGIYATASQIDAAFTVEAFNTSSAVLWTPQFLSVPSRVWLRGDDITGSQSSSVSIWPDTGSYNNYFTQSVGANQPLLFTSSLNGHSVVHFDGSNDRLAAISGSTSITQSSLSVFAVARPIVYPNSSGVSSTSDIIANGHSGNSNDFGLGPRTLSGVHEWSLYNETNATSFDINALATTSQSWFIANGAINSNNSILTVYISNAATSSGVVNGSNLIDLRDMFVGFEPSFGVPFNGEIAEILITTRTLSAPEQQQVEGYLAWKYGLQNNLPTNHPYFAAPPFAVNAGYIQSWKDLSSTTVAYVSSSGLYAGTASWANNAISASWAPPSGVTAFAVSSSWASQSLSASRADTASFISFNNGNPNFIVKWVDSSSISSSTLYDDGTRVGLNTTSPIGKFTINFNNSSTGNTGTDAHIVLANLNSGAQNQIVFLSGSTLAGKIRSDPGGNMVWLSMAPPAQKGAGHWFSLNGDTGTVKMKITDGGVRIAQQAASDAPTAILHLGGGDGTSTRGQLKFDSSTLLSSPEAGVVEFNTDKWFCTINTATARKEFAICDIPLASGSLVGVTTNGRLINATGSGIIWGVSGSYAINSLSASVTGTLVNAPFFIPFVQNTGSQPLYVSNNKTLQYNPAIDTLNLSNITASFLFGTSSWAVSASNAASSAFAFQAATASFVIFAANTISSSWASQSLSTSWAPVPVSASWSSQSIWTTSSSFASQSISASWAFQSVSASWAPPVASDFAISASFSSQSMFSTTASYASSSTTSSYTPTGRSVVLCSAYTPTITGGDPAEVTIPYNALDGFSIQNWNVKRLSFRVQVAESNTSSINIEKSITTGIFSASFVGSVSLLSGSYENFATGSFPTVKSGDKIRFNVVTLGTSQNWTIITELSNS